MFYDTSPFRLPLTGTRDDREHAIVVLLPSESKRLIARGVLRLPEVARVLTEGLLVVSRGITLAFVVEELTGTALPKEYCTVGIIAGGRLSSTAPDRRHGPWVFRGGVLVDEAAEDALTEFSATDVSLKGANAVDPQGHVGVLAESDAGGTIGSIWPTLSARGAHLITPVGLEKLIPSVIVAARKCGNRLFSYAMGGNVGLIPVVTSLVVTEVQALEVITGVTATHVASGGVGGSEGAVILALEGEKEAVDRAITLVESVKGEPATALPDLEPVITRP